MKLIEPRGPSPHATDMKQFTYLYAIYSTKYMQCQILGDDIFNTTRVLNENINYFHHLARTC